MKTNTGRNPQVDELLGVFYRACRPPDRTDEEHPPPRPADVKQAALLKIFRAAVKRQEAEAELARELAAFTVPDEI